MIKISPALSNLPTINTNELHDLQGNLKDLSEADYQRLKKSLTDYGFIIPMFVWFDQSDGGKPYTLDGNQRKRFFGREYPAGVDLPYVEIEASDKSDAKKKILLISSQYGKTTKEGFDVFMADVVGADLFVVEATTFGSFLDEIDDDGAVDTDTPGTTPFSKEVDEESNYVVLLFKTKQDWLQFTSKVDLHTVASTQTNGKERSTGTGRVLDGPETLDILSNY
ncbi:hypothetical protein BH09BAC4_BH09BAC4_28130 [soil metagenome]